MNAQKIQQFILKPWFILVCLVIGFTLGWAFPSLGLQLAVVGDIYVDLLKMIVLPFMVSAIVFSVQKLFQEGVRVLSLGVSFWPSLASQPWRPWLAF